MAVDAPITINGHRYSYASIAVKIAGQEVAALRSINYTSELQPGEIFNADGFVVGRTPGAAKHSCDFEMMRQEWHHFRDNILGQSFGRVVFDVEVQFAEDGEGVSTDVIVGCRIVRWDSKNSEGTEASTVMVSLHVLDIRQGHLGLSISDPFEFAIPEEV